MSKSKLTPVRRQYLEIKRSYPDAILFFRLGDFYETFDEDAEIAARELDIVLTSRNVAKGERIPMAGIPHHAAESYLARLIEKGYHVAICEQIGDGPVKGLFPREVVRVVTPGTVLEPGLLPGDENNYLAAIVLGDDEIGVAYADVSTGEFAASQFHSPEPLMAARQELLRLSPVEILLPETQSAFEMDSTHFTHLPDWKFETERASEKLMAHFSTATLEGYGVDGKNLAVRAAGAIVDYLSETQPAALAAAAERRLGVDAAALRLLTTLSAYSLDEFMVLDAATRRNLELTETIREGRVQGSLLGVLDATVTPLGRRLLRRWLAKPLLNQAQIEARLRLVDCFFTDGMWRTEVRQTIKPLGDLERLVNRISAGVAQPRDLVSLREALRLLPEVRSLLAGSEQEPVQTLLQSIDLCSEALDLLDRSMADDPPATLANMGVIRPEYSNRLSELLQSSKQARDWMNSLESVERRRTGIKNLKVGYNKVFGYYIEVSKSNLDQVPEEYIRRQTLVNAERFVTPEMKDYEAQVLSAEERIRDLETELFYAVCDELSGHSERLRTTAAALARLDVVACFAEVASQKNYVRPQLLDEPVLEIRQGRHPVVEEHLTTSRFVPNDARYENGERIRIITGPNMSGKSTYLRQAALIVLMAQMGSYVPADSARIGLADRIFTRIGAQDEIHAGQSTFMVEMVETANLLNHASERSLLILDEIGRGTSTYDGLSIAWAVVEYIHNHPRLRPRTLFATHYHELTRLAEILPGVRNYNVAVSEEAGRVVFLHKIRPGRADKSYGIDVAQLAGIPPAVIHRAQEILGQLEQESSGHRPREDTEVPARQLPLFDSGHPVVDELKELDIDALSPLEALTKLFEWKSRVQDDEEDTVDAG